MDSREYLNYVLDKLQERIRKLDDAILHGQKEIENMHEYYWENYTEMDQYGYEDFDNQQALLGQVNANKEKLDLRRRFKKMLDSPFFGRVDFIYELSPEDLPALFRLARTFVYLPDAEIEASIVPVVEALRAGLPMVLSDTRLNREAAGDAAVYVDPEAVGEVAAALENVLWDETFRSEMRRREGRRAELFSEYAVARRLIDIYSSL